MLTALMASLASKYNASATLVTMDFFQKWRPNASGKTQVFVGRVSTAVIVLVGILWVLVMKSLGKNLYEYLQSVQGYMSPAIAVLFVMGIFWKRATAPAAFWAFLVGAVGGFFRLGLDLLIERPLKEGRTTPDLLRAQYGVLFDLQQIHWLYYAEALLILCIVLVLAISAFTKAPDPGTVRYTYYGATAEEKAPVGTTGTSSTAWSSSPSSPSSTTTSGRQRTAPWPPAPYALPRIAVRDAESLGTPRRPHPTYLAEPGGGQR
jgi:SSS family solute:Na+ symporter